MNGLYQLEAIGNIGNIDSKIVDLATKGEVPVVNFTLAIHTDLPADEDGVINQDVEWINCTVWNGAANYFNRNFDVGDLIKVKGRPACESWKTEDGEQKVAIKVNVYFTQMVYRKRNAE